ncbi:(2Fe-2S)-binding protein [Streptomyces sp. BI20]|uniref:(2Fe-2S)-binding protein n=1 Tax=Streptomyces sp. BI20 TaxID=3403460 RepID=UPI003C77CE39
MEQILRRLAAVGPFFTVTVPAPEQRSGARPLPELYEDGLDAWVAAVGRRLGTRDTRVAASTAQFGLAARLWSVGLGVIALTGQGIDLRAERVLWRPGPTGSPELLLPEPRPRPAEELPDLLGPGNLDALHTRMRSRHRLSRTVLEGNAASGIAGALRVLHVALPEAADGIAPLAARWLDEGRLAGAGELIHEPGLGTAYRRRSCCLYYRIAPGGFCGDCVLRP